MPETLWEYLRCIKDIKWPILGGYVPYDVTEVARAFFLNCITSAGELQHEKLFRTCTRPQEDRTWYEAWAGDCPGIGKAPFPWAGKIDPIEAWNYVRWGAHLDFYKWNEVADNPLTDKVMGEKLQKDSVSSMLAAWRVETGVHLEVTGVIWTELFLRFSPPSPGTEVFFMGLRGLLFLDCDYRGMWMRIQLDKVIADSIGDNPKMKAICTQLLYMLLNSLLYAGQVSNCSNVEPVLPTDPRPRQERNARKREFEKGRKPEYEQLKTLLQCPLIESSIKLEAGNSTTTYQPDAPLEKVFGKGRVVPGQDQAPWWLTEAPPQKPVLTSGRQASGLWIP